MSGSPTAVAGVKDVTAAAKSHADRNIFCTAKPRVPAYRSHFSPPNRRFGGFGSFHPGILPQSLTDKNNSVQTVQPFKLPWSCWASATSGCICEAPRSVVWLPRCTQGHHCLCTLPYSNHLFKDFWSMSPFMRAEGGEADLKGFFHSRECLGSVLPSSSSPCNDISPFLSN